MLLIDYKPVNFAGNNVTRPDPLHFTWADVVWAATTVGHKQVQPTIQPQAYAYLELLHRINSAYTHLQTPNYQTGLWGVMDTHLIQSPIYQDLETAEKTTASTFVGFIAAKLFAARLLQVSWMFKVDAHSPSSSMIGLNKVFQWVAMSVKGRSNRLDQRLVRRATKQTPKIVIKGSPPKQHINVFSYFTAITKTLKAYLVNIPPAAHDNGNLELNISPDKFLRTYYALIFDFLSTDYNSRTFNESYKDQTYCVKAIPEVDVEVGLNEKIYKLMQTQNGSFFQKLLNDLAATTSQDQAETMIGPDGVFIRLGEAWEDSRMHLPPEQRNGQ